MIKSITITPEQAQKISERAKAEHRSFSGQIVHMADVYMNDQDSEQGRDLAAFIEAAR